MTREQLNTLCAAIKAMKARSDRLERIKTRLEKMRDEAVLPSTKAIYQTIIGWFEEDTV